MRNRLIGLASATVLASTMVTVGCGRTAITVGNPAAGGTLGAGGLSTTGGSAATGGSSSSGGTVGAGGITTTGGSVAAGGRSSSGGTPGTGGNSTTGGSAATGGRSTSTGGTVATGGISGTGGPMATGGLSGTGGSEASCSKVTPCGGDVVGVWTVTSSCLSVSGQVDMSLIGVGCASASVTGALQVNGRWTANANGTYSDETTTSGAEEITLPAACLQVSGTTVPCEQIAGLIQIFGYDSVSCSTAAGGRCGCPATVNQTGGIGLVSMDPSGSGKYTLSGNVLSTDSGARYSYCVEGSRMTWTPQSTSPTTAGTIVFQKQ